MVSVLDLMILWLEVDSVEDLADFGLAGTNPADYSVNFLVDPNLVRFDFIFCLRFFDYFGGAQGPGVVGNASGARSGRFFIRSHGKCMDNRPKQGIFL